MEIGAGWLAPLAALASAGQLGRPEGTTPVLRFGFRLRRGVPTASALRAEVHEQPGIAWRRGGGVCPATPV